jgi:PAS domain S-box-containing protein
MADTGYMEQRFGSAEAHLAAIVDSSSDAIISKNLNSIIMSWNPAAERMFGYSPGEAIGQSVTMLIPPDRHQEEDSIIERIKRGERVETFVTKRLRKDGHPRLVSLTISPVRDENGAIVGASKIARDVSDVRRREGQIRLLLREVNHRVKNQYAVILSMVDETLKRSSSAEAFKVRLRERVSALARSHDLLVASDWSGASMSDLVREHLAPFGHEQQVSVSGPSVILNANQAQYLGMALHELATNSAKYGALHSGQGTVTLEWDVITAPDGVERFSLCWAEVCPTDSDEIRQPTKHGFGTIVLKRVAPHAIEGEASLERHPGSVTWTIVAPIIRDGGAGAPGEV